MSEAPTPPTTHPKAKIPKPPKPPKKVKRGTVIYEPEQSIRKTNLFRDRLITFSGNVNLVLAVALFASTALSVWIVIQPHTPSPFYIQYTSGQIANVTLYSKEQLPPPQPLEILPLAPQARLDDAPVYSGAYVEATPEANLSGAAQNSQESASPTAPIAR